MRLYPTVGPPAQGKPVLQVSAGAVTPVEVVPLEVVPLKVDPVEVVPLHVAPVGEIEKRAERIATITIAKIGYFIKNESKEIKGFFSHKENIWYCPDTIHPLGEDFMHSCMRVIAKGSHIPMHLDYQVAWPCCTSFPRDLPALMDP